MTKIAGCVPAVRAPRGVILAVLAVLLASPALAQKTDVIHLRNGNVIVGEVKKLDRELRNGTVYFRPLIESPRLREREPRLPEARIGSRLH
jgi:hypothetical protein